MARAADDLRRHEEGRARHGVELLTRVHDLLGGAKVREFQRPIGAIDQQIVALEIAVRDFLIVQISQALEHVAGEARGLALCDGAEGSD